MKILFVVSNVGYTWDEVFVAYQVFQTSNYEITLTSPNGGMAKSDPRGDKVQPITSFIGYGTSNARRPDGKLGSIVRKKMANTLSLKGISTSDFDALYLVGGHGALFDLHNNADLELIIKAFFKDGKPVGALCHSSSILACVMDGSRSLVCDYKITGFPIFLEKFLLFMRWTDKQFLPLPLMTGAELDTASTKRNFFMRVREVLDLRYVVRDRNLVTGVGPKATKKVAQTLIKMM